VSVAAAFEGLVCPPACRRVVRRHLDLFHGGKYFSVMVWRTATFQVGERLSEHDWHRQSGRLARLLRYVKIDSEEDSISVVDSSGTMISRVRTGRRLCKSLSSKGCSKQGRAQPNFEQQSCCTWRIQYRKRTISNTFHDKYNVIWRTYQRKQAGQNVVALFPTDITAIEA
jgi:hypothetical protein